MMCPFIQPNSTSWLEDSEKEKCAFHTNAVQLLILKLSSYVALPVRWNKTHNSLSPKQQHCFAASPNEAI